MSSDFYMQYHIDQNTYQYVTDEVSLKAFEKAFIRNINRIKNSGVDFDVVFVFAGQFPNHLEIPDVQFIRSNRVEMYDILLLKKENIHHLGLIS